MTVVCIVYVLCLLVEVAWRLSVSYMRQVDDCLSVTRGKLAVVCGVRVFCELLEVEWRLSVSYMIHIGGCLKGVCTLSGTCGNMAVICQLHETGWWFSAGVYVLCQLRETGLLFSAGCLYSVFYLRQVGGCLQRVCVLCQLLSYLRQVSGYL